MSNLIQSILPSIEHIHLAGYWVAFFAAFLETIVGIGLFLPGSTVILLLGAFSARGSLDTGDLIWFAIIGAVLGDNLNYFLGRKYGARWIGKGFWLLKPNYVEKAKMFMDTHGAKSVFFGRFVPSVKEIVPFIAGSVKMNKKSFLFWNMLGAIGWGAEWVLAGYIFGQSINLALLWLSRAGLLFALILVVGVLLYVAKTIIIRKGEEIWTIAVSLWQSLKEATINNEHVALWCRNHPRIIAFFKARLDKGNIKGMPLTIAVLVFFYIFALFVGIIEDLLTTDPIVAADLRIASLVASFRNDTLTDIFTWITLLGKSWIIVGFIVITAGLLWLWRKSYYIIFLMVAVLGSVASTFLGKLAFHRPRPEFAVYAEHSFSFPSGHATIAVAFYGFVACLLIRFAKNWKQRINIFFTVILLIGAIGLSRIYLGEHYLSDVWAGYLVGGLWLTLALFSAEWFRYHQLEIPTRVPIRKAGQLTILLIFFAVSFYVLFSMNYHQALATSPIKKEIVVSSVPDAFKNDQLKFTETMIGARQEPINFVFLAGDDEQVISVIRDAGWVYTDKADFSSFIKAMKALAAKEKHPSAPMAPSFWDARIQNMGFAKVPGVNWLKNAQHLKVWNTGFSLKNGKTIYAGMANANDGFKWGIIPKISPDLDTERELLNKELNATGNVQSVQKVQLVEPLVGKNLLGDQFFTDGKTYIISFH